jgi:parallel beta helix pectate lyase-like protein
LVLLAAVAMVLPSIWLGDSVVTAPRVGATWVRPLAAPVPASCGGSGVICITTNRSTRLDINQSNVIVDGLGHTVPGIRITGNNVTVQNFRVINAEQTGIRVEGDGITVRNNDISQVSYGTDDIDAIRFFGDDIRILDNSMYDIVKGEKFDAHVDCAQTWASPATGSSSNIVIEGNHCQDADFSQCLMAEGPGSTDGGGGASGVSENWTVRGNHYECHANQTIAFRDIDNAVIENNNFQGSGNKAIQLTDGSSGISIQNNILGPGYRSLVGD